MMIKASLVLLNLFLSIFIANGSGAKCSDGKWTCVQYDASNYEWACCRDGHYNCEFYGGSAKLATMSTHNVKFCGWVTGTEWGWTKTDTFGKCANDELCFFSPKKKKGGYPKGTKFTQKICDNAQFKRGQQKKAKDILKVTKITGGKPGPETGLVFYKHALLKVDGVILPPSNRRSIFGGKIHWTMSKIDESEPWVHGLAFPAKYQNIEDLAYTLEIVPPHIEEKAAYSEWKRDLETLEDELGKAKITKEYTGTTLKVEEGAFTRWGEKHTYHYIALPLGGKMVDINDIETDGTHIHVEGKLYEASKTVGAAKLTIEGKDEVGRGIIIYVAGNNVAARRGYDYDNMEEEYVPLAYNDYNGFDENNSLVALLMVLDVFTIFMIGICMTGFICLLFGAFAFFYVNKMNKSEK